MPQALNPLDLIRDWKAEGWQPGPPERLPVEVLMQDIDAYRRMPCEACRCRRQKVLPFHRGPEYLLLIVCRRCGNAQM